MKCSEFVIQSVNDGTRSIDMRIAYFRRIVKLGNSYAVAVPKDVRILMEANEGDWVRIEIEKIEVIKDDTNLHDDNAARQDPEARNKGIHQDA